MSDRYLTKIDMMAERVSGPVAAEIAQFSTRAAAEAAARSIGWSTCDAMRVEIMGFRVWVIVDPHGNAVSKDGLRAWQSERESGEGERA